MGQLSYSTWPGLSWPPYVQALFPFPGMLFLGLSTEPFRRGQALSTYGFVPWRRASRVGEGWDPLFSQGPPLPQLGVVDSISLGPLRGVGNSISQQWLGLKQSRPLFPTCTRVGDQANLMACLGEIYNSQKTSRLALPPLRERAPQGLLGIVVREKGAPPARVALLLHLQSLHVCRCLWPRAGPGPRPEVWGAASQPNGNTAYGKLLSGTPLGGPASLPAGSRSSASPGSWFPCTSRPS